MAIYQGSAVAGRFSITLAVEPVPKGRPRFGHGHVYTPERTAQFETTVRWLLRQQKVPLLDGDVGMEATFWIRRAGSDGDNYLKALWDASNGICWKDDRQIKDWRGRLLKIAGDQLPCIEFSAWTLLSTPGSRAGAPSCPARSPCTRP